MAGVRIRSARVGDAPAIARIHWDSWVATYTGVFPQAVFDDFSFAQREKLWTHETARHADASLRRQVLVAELEGCIAGFASVGPYRVQESDDPAAALDGELFAIYLDPPLQRKGVGRALWGASNAWLHGAGFVALRLWCVDGNEAEAFYRAMGAQCVARKSFDAHGSLLYESCYRAATHSSPPYSS
ncbi:MAG: GNAT family N-acetyltransferase [Burkholderiales bacterium]